MNALLANLDAIPLGEPLPGAPLDAWKAAARQLDATIDLLAGAPGAEKLRALLDRIEDEVLLPAEARRASAEPGGAVPYEEVRRDLDLDQ